jgi:exonuclease SbcC
VHRATVVDLLRHLGDRFEQVILITHIESVREMLDHVVSVRFDYESGASVVTAVDGTGPAVAVDERPDMFENAGAPD